MIAEVAGSLQISARQLLSILLTLFVLLEVNYPHLSPQSQLAVFAWIGFLLCFWPQTAAQRPWQKTVGWIWSILSSLVCGYIVTQTEPFLRSLWSGTQSLGDRAGQEGWLEVTVGLLGVLVVLEVARRSIGWTLPVLALVFLLYALAGPWLPQLLLPHRGYDLSRIVSQVFLHSQGVFGIALRVMFTYVFLFVALGAWLEMTGATRFVIDLSRRWLGRTSGGAAKVAVLSSGFMGSLSGSAVANTATTGAFTIPLMRSAGFRRHVAAGVEAAASSGGALMPPVMGAAAYMMLEMVEPPVSYLTIIRSALIPAMLFYFSLLTVVHLHARRIDASGWAGPEDHRPLDKFSGLIFALALGSLLFFLLQGFTPFRAVSLSMGFILLLWILRQKSGSSWSWLNQATIKAAATAVPLIGAAACVGMIIGVVTLTGLGTRLPALILPLAQNNLLLALILIMLSSIVLGMGLPSAVCYLLMATFVGPILGHLGVVPLAAHFFIFYFGMMSMVTPPVALAAYTAASIAGAGIMRSSLSAFRFALVGFTLPYMFVFRTELLLLGPEGDWVSVWSALPAIGSAVAGIFSLAAAITGYLKGPLSYWRRLVLLAGAALLLLPNRDAVSEQLSVSLTGLVGLLILLTLILLPDRIRRNRV